MRRVKWEEVWEVIPSCDGHPQPSQQLMTCLQHTVLLWCNSTSEATDVYFMSPSTRLEANIGQRVGAFIQYRMHYHSTIIVLHHSEMTPSQSRSKSNEE